ncbi:MAG: hypothetical protein KAI22_04085 [Gammaproteobacteria bacterium]|nr:hypothetical protein [Gammaproteobacteria bacterium]
MPLLIKFTLYSVLIFFLISCSVQPVSNPAHQISFPKPVLSTSSITAQELSKYWWYARFKFVWSEKAETVNFSDNLFIAHQVIIPVLDAHHDDIQLWRFHRRAADDNAGHQFSFIFYATQQTAGTIFQQIENNSLVKQLLNEDILERIRLDDITQPKRQNIADTSDRNWSYAIQKSWPYYIMGVSTLWLDLLNQEITKSQLDTSQAIHLQRVHYKDINEQITRQWKEQGNHAFFHHISAIFGYESLEIRF